MWAVIKSNTFKKTPLNDQSQMKELLLISQNVHTHLFDDGTVTKQRVSIHCVKYDCYFSMN